MEARKGLLGQHNDSVRQVFVHPMLQGTQMLNHEHLKPKPQKAIRFIFFGAGLWSGKPAWCYWIEIICNPPDMHC